MVFMNCIFAILSVGLKEVKLKFPLKRLFKCILLPLNRKKACIVYIYLLLLK